jgi:signal peptidase II
VRTGWIVTAAAVFAADRLSKYALGAALRPHESRAVIPRLLYVTYVDNPHGAFGLGGGSPWLLAAASALALGLLYRLVRELTARSALARIGFGAVAGGALGNLADRLWRGSVLDFIDVRVWPVFNLADSAVTLGIGMIAFAGRRRT